MYAHGLYSAGALWPLWAVHTVILVLNILVLSYLVLEFDGEFHALPSGYTTALAFAVVNFVAEPLEMVLWTYHLLEPLLYLVLQVMKAILWTVVCGLGFWILLAPKIFVEYEWLKILLYTLLAVTLPSFYASLIYAAVIFHRSNKTVGYESPPEKEQMAFRNSVAILHTRESQHGLIRPVSSVYTD